MPFVKMIRDFRGVKTGRILNVSGGVSDALKRAKKAVALEQVDPPKKSKKK